MKGWKLWTIDGEGRHELAGELSGKVAAEHVQIVSHLVADDARKPVAIQAPGQRRPNPSSIGAPLWRLSIKTTETTLRRGIGAPAAYVLADVYAPATRRLVERVAQVFADAADMPVAIERAPFRNPVRRGIDRRSIRTARSGKLVGCPTGHYHPRRRSSRKCDTSMTLAENPSVPLVQLNRYGGRQWVLAWGDAKRYGEARKYANRTQATRARAKLPDPDAFEVWQGPQGRVFYLRPKSQPASSPASKNPRLWRSKIHRAGLSGGTACGTPGYVSTSGVGVTCDKCLALEAAPSRAEVLESIRRAAERFRSRRGNPGPWVSYEVARVLEHGGYVTRDYDNTPGAFWTLYGRRPDGTADALEDFTNEADALEAKRKRESNPRELEAGEAVFVPYVGTSKRRTSERATVIGPQDAAGDVVVEVRKGKTTQTRLVPAHQVRRAPARGPAAYRKRVTDTQERLELKESRKRAKQARADAARERAASDCANAKALQLQPHHAGEKPTAEYRRELAAVRRHQVKAEAFARIAHELERNDPAYADPWAVDNPRAARLSWNTWGGGTGAWEGAHSYSAIAPWGTYYVDPVTTAYGRRAGYVVRLSVERPNQAPAGFVGPGLWHQLARASSPNEGKKVARLHFERGLSMQQQVDNPRGELREAVKTFERWHEFKPEGLETVDGPPRTIPRTLVKLGDLAEVAYVSDKYTGKPVEYVHRFESPLPVLATDPKGRHLHVVGGGFRITSDGLVG